MIESVHVIGSGRVGSAVAARLRERGVAVRRRRARLVLLCVPDTAIADVAGTEPGPAGSRTSAARRRSPRSTRTRAGSAPSAADVHRSGGPEQLDGAWAAITGETDEARAAGRELAEMLGLQPFELADDDRPLYHAGAVFASNYLVTLQRAARRGSAGRRRGARAADARTIENGFELTGPIARGDWATVDAHRAAIHERAPELEPVYVALAEATVALA